MLWYFVDFCLRYEKNNEHIINLLLAYGGTLSLQAKNAQGKAPVDLTNSECVVNARFCKKKKKNSFFKIMFSIMCAFQ